jgi:hypothetical protein
LDAMVATEGLTQQASRDCEAAEFRLQDAAEAMIAAEKTLMGTTPTTADGMAALKRYVNKTI